MGRAWRDSDEQANGSTRMRLLLVEDQDDHAELIIRAFRRHAGWASPVVARSIAEARRALVDARCDLVVADFLLPDGRGIELLPGTRDDAGCPYIIMTSHGDEQLAVDAMKAGAMDYIVKSDEMFRALPRLCDRVVREWRLLDERRRTEARLRLNEHMVSSTSDLLVYVDSHYIVRAANQRYFDALELDADEVIDQPSSKVLGGTVFEHSIRPNVDRALGGERHVSQNWRDYPGLGLRFMDVEYSPYVGPGGCVEGVVMRGRDITGMRKAVDALRVSEARLRTIIDSTPECIKTVAADGTIVDMNQAGLEILGLRDITEICGRSFFDVVEPESAEAIRAMHARVMSGERAELEFRVAHTSGRKLWLQTIAAPLRDESGAVTAALAVTRDFTARRTIEQELRSSEARFRGLFETVPVGVYQTSRDGAITVANPVLMRMLGLPVDALDEGPKVESFYRGAVPWSTLIRRLLADERLDGLECRLARGDGSELDALVSVRTIRNGQGDVVSYEGTVTDISELVSARAAREHNERLLRTVIDLVPHMIFVCDRDGRVLLANRSTMVAAGLAPADGDPARLQADAAVADISARLLAGEDAPGMRTDSERIISTRAGERVVELNAIPFTPPGRSDAAVVGVAVDVTRERRTQALVNAETDALRSMTHGKPVDETLEGLCRSYASLEPGSVCALIDDTGEQPVVRVAPGLDAPTRALLDATAKAIDVRDRGDDIAVAELTGSAAWRAIGHWSTCWEVVLRDSDGGVLGRCVVLRPAPGAPTDEQAAELRSVAYLSGIALERHRQAQRSSALMTVLETTPDIVAMLDAQGQPFYMNRAGLEQLGYRRRHLGEITLDQLHPAAVARMIRNEGLAVAARDGVWRDETLFRRRDGGQFVASQVVVAHYSPDGGLDYFSTIARDLSQRLEAEKALRASEGRNRALVDSAPEAILVLDVGSGRFVDMNDNACRLTGHRRIELAERGPHDVSASDQPGGYDAGALFTEQVARALNGKTPVFEWLLKAADGSEIPCEVRLSQLPSVGRTLVRASLFDITDRKRAERALRESELRFQGIFNQTSGFIAVMSVDGTVVDINDPGLRATGLHRRDIIGQPLWAAPWWIDDRSATREIRRLAGNAASGQPGIFQLDFRDADGATRTVRGTLSPILNHAGEVSMLIAEANDVTERVRSEEKLKDYAARLQVLSQQLLETQENERRHIARELHDEIGQALTALKINLHTAATQYGESYTAGELFSDSLEITENVLRQVRDLSLDLRPSMLDDLGLAAALRWYTTRQAQRSGIPIELELPDALPRLKGQPETACFRVVQEALTNVMRHARARRIGVSIAFADDELSARISDDGVGFDVVELRTRARQGRSFGLLGMQERVQLAGGSMRIDSAPGEGTRVQVRFPGAGERTDHDATAGVA